MLSNTGFSGYMTSFTPFAKDMTIKYKINLKVVIDGDVQTFFNSLDRQGTDHFSKHLSQPIEVDSLMFKNLSMPVIVTMDADGESPSAFDAELTMVKMSRKCTQVASTYTYNITLIKEQDADRDALLQLAYLNAKEENEEGKEQKIEFSITMEHREDDEDSDSDSTMIGGY